MERWTDGNPKRWIDADRWGDWQMGKQIDGSNLNVHLLTPLHPLGIQTSISEHALAEISFKGIIPCKWIPSFTLYTSQQWDTSIHTPHTSYNSTAVIAGTDFQVLKCCKPALSHDPPSLLCPNNKTSQWDASCLSAGWKDHLFVYIVLAPHIPVASFLASIPSENPHMCKLASCDTCEALVRRGIPQTMAHLPCVEDHTPSCEGMVHDCSQRNWVPLMLGGIPLVTWAVNVHSFPGTEHNHFQCYLGTAPESEREHVCGQVLQFTRVVLTTVTCRIHQSLSEFEPSCASFAVYYPLQYGKPHNTITGGNQCLIPWGTCEQMKDHLGLSSSSWQ